MGFGGLVRFSGSWDPAASGTSTAMSQGMPHPFFVEAPVLVVVAIILLGSCETTSAGGRTTTTAADQERYYASSRTIDNAGWVDAAGRPSSETNRTELSGMRPTEVGSERPTGTPGSGFSTSSPRTIARETIDDARALEGKPQAPAPPPKTSGVSIESAVERVMSAYCDRENACGHVGEKQRWGTPLGCRMDSRTPLVERIDACRSGIDPEVLSSCLATLRDRACDDARPPQDLPSCLPDTLCKPQTR